MTTVQVTREKILSPGVGYAWYWHYYLPARETTLADGRVVVSRFGGARTKAETRDLVRKLYPERPLTIVWPDGKTEEVKR